MYDKLLEVCFSYYHGDTLSCTYYSRVYTFGCCCIPSSTICVRFNVCPKKPFFICMHYFKLGCPVSTFGLSNAYVSYLLLLRFMSYSDTIFRLHQLDNLYHSETCCFDNFYLGIFSYLITVRAPL